MACRWYGARATCGHLHSALGAPLQARPRRAARRTRAAGIRQQAGRHGALEHEPAASPTGTDRDMQQFHRNSATSDFLCTRLHLNRLEGCECRAGVGFG